MEAGIIKVKAERVLEVDPAPHRLGGTAADRPSRNCSTLTVAS
jgi:hypothetical protein